MLAGSGLSEMIDERNNGKYDVHFQVILGATFRGTSSCALLLFLVSWLVILGRLTGSQYDFHIIVVRYHWTIVTVAN
jgi:hypothetical protein